MSSPVPRFFSGPLLAWAMCGVSQHQRWDGTWECGGGGGGGGARGWGGEGGLGIS